MFQKHEINDVIVEIQIFNDQTWNIFKKLTFASYKISEVNVYFEAKLALQLRKQCLYNKGFVRLVGFVGDESIPLPIICNINITRIDMVVWN